MFDIDNRAGQETGYLFEPIIAHCIGGVSFGATNSPIKRIGGKGGRQVDCLREEIKTAYEVKVRVTIAASGQVGGEKNSAFPLKRQRAATNLFCWFWILRRTQNFLNLLMLFSKRKAKYFWVTTLGGT